MFLPDSHITLHTDSIPVCQVSVLSAIMTKAVQSTGDLPFAASTSRPSVQLSHKP